MNKRETVVSLLVKPARRQAGRGSIQLDLNRLFNRIFNKVFIVVWGTRNSVRKSFEKSVEIQLN